MEFFHTVDIADYLLPLSYYSTKYIIFQYVMHNSQIIYLIHPQLLVVLTEIYMHTDMYDFLSGNKQLFSLVSENVSMYSRIKTWNKNTAYVNLHLGR